VEMKSIRVWDLPTRLFHWGLAITVIGSFISVKIGGNAMDWHARFGYCALALLGFRWCWGFWGSRYARFAQFMKGPKAVIAEMRGALPTTPGHNPLGAISVMGLLLVFTFQATLGLMTTDEIAFDGPLVKHVSSDMVALASRLHQQLEWVLIGLVALHVGAIVFHARVRRHNLVPAMIHGNQRVSLRASEVAARDDWALRIKAAVIAAFIATAVALIAAA
jgi:cytochrome b